MIYSNKPSLAFSTNYSWQLTTTHPPLEQTIFSFIGTNNVRRTRPRYQQRKRKTKTIDNKMIMENMVRRHCQSKRKKTKTKTKTHQLSRTTNSYPLQIQFITISYQITKKIYSHRIKSKKKKKNNNRQKKKKNKRKKNKKNKKKIKFKKKIK